MLKFIWRFIENWYITKAQARSIEAFIIWTAFSILIGVSSNIEAVLNWEEINWILFLTTEAVVIWKSITMGITKYLRDKKNELLDK